jgi:DNA-directed RNA polymerase specialized sigma24 family protein
MIRDLFFDQSRCPVRTTGFDYDALDLDAAKSDQHLKDRYTISEWFRLRFEWILTGRTPRSREIRQAIVQAEIEGTRLSVIAKRFRVSRQSVQRQSARLRKLTRFLIGENP